MIIFDRRCKISFCSNLNIFCFLRINIAYACVLRKKYFFSCAVKKIHKINTVLFIYLFRKSIFHSVKFVVKLWIKSITISESSCCKTKTNTFLTLYCPCRTFNTKEFTECISRYIYRYYYSVKNPSLVFQTDRQQRWLINIWEGIVA